MIQFEFDGHTSNEYGIIVTGIENNDTLSTRSLQLGTKNKYRPRENHFGALYDDNYSFNLTVMKTPCRNKNVIPRLENGILKYESDFTPELNNGLLSYPITYNSIIKKNILTSYDTDYLLSSEVRRVNAWLTSPQYPKLFKFINNDYFLEEIEFFVTITEITAEATSLPYSLSYTVTSDSPYAYTPERIYNISSTSTLSTIYTITNNSDCHEEYVYPIIKVSPKSHGTITIRNKTDNNGTLSINSLKNDVFYIDCQHLKLYDITKSLVTFEDLGIKDVDEIYWPRLAYGNNIFEFTGNADFEIIYREPRKVGAFA